MTVNRSNVFGECITGATQYVAYGFGFRKVASSRTLPEAKVNTIPHDQLLKYLKNYVQDKSVCNLKQLEAESNRLCNVARLKKSEVLSVAFYILAKTYEPIFSSAFLLDKTSLKQKIICYYRNAIALTSQESRSDKVYRNYYLFLGSQ